MTIKKSRFPILLKWEGPHTERSADDVSDLGLGQLYYMLGDSHVHGTRSLLYLGLTTRGVARRWGEHKHWLEREWKWRLELFVTPVPLEAGELLGSDALRLLETLLIYSHQPIYNSTQKGTVDLSKLAFTVWNTGSCPRLLPEVSSDHPWNT